MIKSFRHTGIVVNDLEKCCFFYQSLGFIIASQDKESGSFIDQVTGYTNAELEWIKMSLPCGYLLELLHYRHPTSPPPSKVPYPANQPGCSHIAVTVDNAEKCLAQIKANGGSIINAPAKAPNNKVRVAYAYDPEGVLLEIVEEI